MPAFSVSRLIEPMLIPLLFIGYGGKIQVMEKLCFKRAPAGSHGGRSVQSVPAQGICLHPPVCTGRVPRCKRTNLRSAILARRGGHAPISNQ